MHDLTISIGTIDRIEMLDRCLRSIYEEDDPALEFKVVVVNNGSRDESIAERIAESFPQATLIQSKEKLGYCRTHNIVLGQSNSRYALLLDDDTVVPKGTLKKMVDFMDAHPNIGVAGCKTVHPDGKFQKSYGLDYNLKTEFLNALKLSSFWPDRIYRDLSEPRDVEWIMSTFLIVRAEVLETAGLLDEDYYTYVTEPDWCYRIRKSGWRVVYVPGVAIVHACGNHSIYTEKRKYGDLVRGHVNRYLFFRKHYGPFSYQLLRPIMIVGSLLRMVYFALLYLLRPDFRTEAAVRVRTFWKVVKMSLGPNPHRFPEELQETSLPSPNPEERVRGAPPIGRSKHV